MEDRAGDDETRRVVFVTVGTTSFDTLVKAVDSPMVKQELFTKGYTHLLIQRGRGSYVPTKSEGGSSLAVHHFNFSSSIADHLNSASLVISHAGSGSIFETLRLGKPLIVVVNEDLMDNHQSELAEELADRKHLYCARPQTLHQTIADMDLNSLVPYSPVPSRQKKHLGRMVRFTKFNSGSPRKSISDLDILDMWPVNVAQDTIQLQAVCEKTAAEFAEELIVMRQNGRDMVIGVVIERWVKHVVHD